eukprot:1357155-Rhodomonas_salina.1
MRSVEVVSTPATSNLRALAICSRRDAVYRTNPNALPPPMKLTAPRKVVEVLLALETAELMMM